MSEFSVGEHQYRSETMDARTQLHIARRLMPVLPSFREMLISDPEDPMAQLKALQPLAEAIAGMKDADVDYILDACMRHTFVAQRHGANGDISGWTRMWNEAAGRAQFKVNMDEMLQIARTLIVENIGGFLSEPLSSLNEEPVVTS